MQTLPRQQKRGTESTSPPQLPGNIRFEESRLLGITQEDRDIRDRLTEQERFTFTPNSVETHTAARQTNTDVTSDKASPAHGGSTTRQCRIPANGTKLQRNENKFTVANEILTVKEEIAKGSFEVETKDESEAGSQGIITALTAVKSEIPSEELPATELILCVNSLLANSLRQARQKPEKSRRLRLALQEIDNIPERTKIIAHHVSREVGLH
jgi:hypothetical protein